MADASSDEDGFASTLEDGLPRLYPGPPRWAFDEAHCEALLADFDLRALVAPRVSK